MGADRVIGHKEWAGKSQGKWDPGAIDMNIFRADIQARLSTPAPQEDELTPEQDQMLRAIFREQTQRHPSRSALRKPGEGLVDTWAGMTLNSDGNLHFVASFLRAWLGHPKTLEELRTLASNTERPDDAELAQAILAEVADKPQPMVVNTTGGVDTSAVVDAVRSAVAEAEPKIIYTAAPQPVAPQEPVAAATVSPTGSTGQRVGQLVDVLESLDLSSELPPEAKAPLQALINVLQTKIGASS